MKVFILSQIIACTGWVIKKWILKLPTNWKDSEQVRLFIINYSGTMQQLALATETKIDDAIVDKLILLANNKIAWDIVFRAIVNATQTDSKYNDARRGLLRRILSQRQTSNTAALQDDYTELANRITSIIHAFQ